MHHRPPMRQWCRCPPQNSWIRQVHTRYMRIWSQNLRPWQTQDSIWVRHTRYTQNVRVRTQNMRTITRNLRVITRNMRVITYNLWVITRNLWVDIWNVWVRWSCRFVRAGREGRGSRRSQIGGWFVGGDVVWRLHDWLTDRRRCVHRRRFRCYDTGLKEAVWKIKVSVEIFLFTVL